MILNKLILDNFITYDHLEYEFENRPLLVQGLNLTDDDQESNGAGKSGIQSGIEFCITASNSRDVRDLELVSYGYEEARAQLFASCDMRKETIHIDWTIKVKGSNKLTIKKVSLDELDSWEEVSFSNVNDGKKWILDWFDISKEDLFNYFIINKSRFKSFFKSSNKDKVDLINRFSDASIISGLEEIQSSELESEAARQQAAIYKTEGQIEMVLDNVKKEEDRDLKAEMEDDLLEIDEEIEDLELTIKNNDSSIQTLKLGITGEKIGKKDTQAAIDAEGILINGIVGEIKKAEDSLNNFTTTDWDKKRETFLLESDKISKDGLKNRNEIRDLKLKETELLSFLRKIEVALSGSIECPNCKHEFILEGDIEKLQEDKKVGLKLKNTLEVNIHSIDIMVELLNVKLDVVSKQISLINQEERAELQEKNSYVEVVNNINKILNGKKYDITRLETEIGNINRKILSFDESIGKLELNSEGIRNEIKVLKAERSSLKAIDNKGDILILKNNLEQLNEVKISQEIGLAKINDDIYLRNQWKNNFKQFRGFLANQSLEVMEFHCNRYLKNMSSDLEVKFEGFKTLANGTFKDEITSKIIRGVERSFSSFSGGEQGRLLFASILANRHMINKTHKYGGLDFLSVDEIFEGVDSIGLTHLIESAKELNITAMIITHVVDKSGNEDILTIVKENGISRIELTN